MKRIIFVFILVSLTLGACASGGEAGQVEELTLIIGAEEFSLGGDDLAGIAEVQSEYEGSVYIGVPVIDLLQFADVDPGQVNAVVAIAADGYSVSYGSDHFTREDVLVAYSRAEGAMSREDGTFRMVLPGEEGKLNLRMLTDLQVELK